MSEGEKVKSFFLTLGAILISTVISLVLLIFNLLPRSILRRSVHGKIVLMTGGGSGIGRLVSQRLASKGATIVTWDVNTEGNEETAKLIRESGGKCSSYTVDLCNRDAIYKAAETVKKEVGKVDILINNAGIVTGNSFMDCPDDSIVRCFDVNIMSHFWTLKAFLPDMQSRNDGHIVTVASLAGIFGNAKLVDYCASKFAAVGLDESLRVELQTEGYNGIKTTVVCPYYINTGMFAGVKSRSLRIMEPNEVADEITDAILMGKKKLVLPKLANILVIFKGFVPCHADVMLQSAMGINEAMEAFVGRKSKKQ